MVQASQPANHPHPLRTHPATHIQSTYRSFPTCTAPKHRQVFCPKLTGLSLGTDTDGLASSAAAPGCCCRPIPLSPTPLHAGCVWAPSVTFTPTPPSLPPRLHCVGVSVLSFSLCAGLCACAVVAGLGAGKSSPTDMLDGGGALDGPEGAGAGALLLVVSVLVLVWLWVLSEDDGRRPDLSASARDIRMACWIKAHSSSSSTAKSGVRMEWPALSLSKWKVCCGGCIS
mmetsp:Transcript_23674/g.68090  ORF Transcript_23674/g.68090 Transcript_23674/m.68090 type:complete len:228 (+) Transcript_23674:831-1514(+)